jgi:hypothetical protein
MMMEDVRGADWGLGSGRQPEVAQADRRKKIQLFFGRAFQLFIS